jgi:hypothetical protein
MIDPLTRDLNRYLDTLDLNEEAEELSELEIYRDRLHFVTKALDSGLDKHSLARRLVKLIEHYVEESHEQD